MLKFEKPLRPASTLSNSEKLLIIRVLFCYGLITLRGRPAERLKMISLSRKLNTSNKPALRRKVGVLSLILALSLSLSMLAPLPSSAERKYPADVQQRILSASKLLHSGNLAGARRELSEVLKVEPECPEAYNNIGISYFREQRMKEAEENFRQALSLDPLYLDGLINLALSLYEQGESHYDEAILYFRQALSLQGGKDAQVHKSLADVLRDKGAFQESAKHYSEALKLKPDYAPTYNGLGMLYYKLKQYDQAAIELSKAIKLRPDYALGYFHLGMVEAARKHPDAAIEAFETSLKYETNPHYANETRQKLQELKGLAQSAGSSTQAVLALVKQRQWEKAEAEMNAVMSTKAGQTPQNWNNLGYILARRGKYDEAQRAYRKAIELKKGPFPDAHYNLGQVLRLEENKLDAAADEFRLAVAQSKEIKKSFPAAYNALGLILKSKGKLKEAERNYKLALSQAGTSLPVVHYNLAILLERMENTREAVREYKQYLTLSPNGVSAKQAKQRLKRLVGTDQVR